MKDAKTPAVPKTLRRLARHQQLSELSLTYEGSKQTLRVHPPNLSSKGMFINTDVSLPEGSILKLSFRLARTGARITARCEVRYCAPGAGLGVEFIDLPPECARAIEAEIGMAGGSRRGHAPAKRRRSIGK
jgi:PilZ domain